MDMERFESQVESIEELARNEKTQMEIGRRLVQEVAQAVLLERKGAEIKDPDVELNIRKGDLVPAQLAGRVATDAEGRALQDAAVQYQNLVIWIRFWIRFWVRISFPWVFRDMPLNRFEEFHERVAFSTEELKLIERLRSVAR
jgi:hypothetical protein